MISRRFLYALLLSLVVHVFLVSAIVIVPAENISVSQPYTRVNFLGPILQKTTFDIMLKDLKGGVLLPQRMIMMDRDINELEVANIKKELSLAKLSGGYLEEGKKELDSILMGEKKTLEVSSSIELRESGVGKKSDVLYQPELLVIDAGEFDGISSFFLDVRIYTAPDGVVEKVDLLGTTGYPEVDLKALRHVKGWIFQKSEHGKWRRVSVKVKTRESDNND